MPNNIFFGKKVYFLLLSLILLIIFLSLFNFACLPVIDKCPFVNWLICFSGKQFNQYNWEKIGAKGYLIKNPIKIRAPFAGTFIYSPLVNINYQGQHLGVLGVLSFKSEQGQMELYAKKVELLKGHVATEQTVEKGEVVAKILPEAISFLNNYSFLKADFKP